jgi:hypothetical protein
MPRTVKNRRVALPEKIGKIRQHLTDNYSIFPDDFNDQQNGHMLLLTIANDRSIGKTLRSSCAKLSECPGWGSSGSGCWSSWIG